MVNLGLCRGLTRSFLASFYFSGTRRVATNAREINNPVDMLPTRKLNTFLVTLGNLVRG